MYSPGIEKALRTAYAAHEGQLRKGGNVPYVLHPIHAAMMLLRLGATEETVQAAILHDVVEDCAGWTLERVEAEFGASVRSIVAELTEDKSKTWAERKQAAVDHVPRMSSEAVAVKAADKLHNLSSLVAQLQATEDPAEVWKSFNGGRERTIRMADELVKALALRVDERLGSALATVLDVLKTH